MLAGFDLPRLLRLAGITFAGRVPGEVKTLHLHRFFVAKRKRHFGLQLAQLLAEFWLEEPAFFAVGAR